MAKGNKEEKRIPVENLMGYDVLCTLTYWGMRDERGIFLSGGEIFLSGGGNLMRSDFELSNLFQS